ncbi:MAG: Crp/Fnr family transcriptional regulator [Bacteroidales bacterium]|nr:Crp/Fnr family transcriptional regulator [Bacteroidales bacterium]
MVKKSQFEVLAKESLSELWDALTPEEKRVVTSNFSVVKFRKGQIIYAEHDEPEYLYCLLNGKAKMYKDGVGGRQQILRLYRPTQYFGYRAYFAGEPYVSSVAAVEASEVGMIHMDIVKDFINENVKLAWFFIHELSHNLGGSDTKIVNLTQKHIRGRLAETLVMLIDSYGLEDDGETLNIYLAREDIANISNMTTSNAIRTLSAFQNEKILTVDGRRIKVLDYNTLKKISKFG